MPRRSCGFADRAKPTAEHGIGRQAEIHDIENIEELRAKLQNSPLAIDSMSERRVLDQCEIKLMKAWSAKGIASKRTEDTLVWATASWNVNGNRKERTIVRTPAEIILANRATR